MRTGSPHERSGTRVRSREFGLGFRRAPSGLRLLGFERAGEFAGVVEAGNAGDEQEIADAGGVGERWGFDVGGRGEVGDGHGGFDCFL